MSGADAVLAHGLLSAMAAISSSSSMLRRVPDRRHDECCTILDRQTEIVEAFVFGMTDGAKEALEGPLSQVSTITRRLVDLVRRSPLVPVDDVLGALIESCEAAASALRGFMQGFSPEVVAALDGLGQRHIPTEARGSAAPG
jgi:hypothetical protein